MKCIKISRKKEVPNFNYDIINTCILIDELPILFILFI